MKALEDGMLTLLFRSVLVSVLILSANAYGQQNDCVQHNKMEIIAKNFSQFDKFLSNKKEYCESDMGEQWFKIAKSLVVLIDSVPNEPNYDINDALTYKAISEKDWWSYFTKRATTFSIKSRCREGVVAYVQPFFGRGRINLCELFFQLSVTSQASTMMHEVRHFDGHGHVTCAQGLEQGFSGACDSKITNKGSYAISVQTLVGFARSKNIPEGERSRIEAEAIYMAYNKFNVVPQVEIEKSIVLSNSYGEVYNWSLGGSADLIKVLETPAVIRSSGRSLTVYPQDRNLDAYRIDETFQNISSNPGMYATFYNDTDPAERGDYDSISYAGAGGILKDNTLTTICDYTDPKLSSIKLDQMGLFSKIVTISSGPLASNEQSYLLSASGELTPYKCKNHTSSAVDFSGNKLQLSEGSDSIVQGFGVDGEQYALLRDGSLSKLKVNGKMLNLLPLQLPIRNQDWVSAAPMSKAKVF